MNLIELVAKLSLDNKQYLAGLAASKGEAMTFTRLAGGGLKKLSKLAVGAMAGASTAVTAFGVSAVKTGMGFDKAMSQVAATMGKTMDEMANEVGTVDLAWGTFSGNLREYAQEMGAHTAFSAKESADALNYMALAGYNAQESMTMLPNVLNLAAAGSMDLAKASDMVTDTQTAFGLKMEEMPQLIDEMAKAASTGNTSVEQLGDAFLTIGGLAQELNGGMVQLANGTKAPVSGIQEMEIALTAMANAGIKGSEAGTHMRNMLLKLSSPTSEGTKQLESMGVAVFDAEGNMRSLSNIFGDLNGKLSNMTQQDKIQAISDLFNTRDLASAEALLHAVGEDWDNIGASILDAEGAAQKMADTQLDNLAGDITLFKSALEGAQIALSDGLSPALRKFVQEGTSGLTEFTEKLKSGDFVGAAESIGKALGNVATNIISKLPQLIAAGGALLKGAVSGIAEQLPPVLAQLATTALESLNTLGASIGEKFPAMLQNALTNLVGITEVIRGAAGMFVDSGLTIVKNIADGIIQNIPTIIQTVPTIVTNIAGIINDNAPKLLATGIQIIASLAKGIVQAIPLIIQNLPQIINAIWNAFTAVNWLALGGQLITAIGNGITSLGSSIPSALKNIASKAVSAFKSAGGWSAVGKTVMNLLISGINALVSLPSTLLKKAASLAMKAFTGVAWGNVGKEVINGIARGITAGVGTIINAAKSAAKKALDAAKSALGIKSPSTVFRDQVGKNISLGMALGIERSEKAVATAMDGLNSYMLDSVPDFSISPSVDTPLIDTASMETGLARQAESKVVNIYNTISVNGAEDPELWADKLVRRMRLDMRTA